MDEEVEVEMVVVVVAVEVPLVGVEVVEGVAPVATVSIFYFFNCRYIFVQFSSYL